MKKAYQPPHATVHGDIRAITAHSTNGNYTDAMFPSGTFRGDITFS